jgi:pimeloyl-ACP methyl ester carboxylesterase
MTTTTATNARNGLADRFAGADARLWAIYGLTPRERLVEIGRAATRIRVAEVGTGEPVLLIHGTAGPGSWPSLIHTLPPARYLVLDRPGWGGSDPLAMPGERYRAMSADLLAGVLDAFDIPRATVIGGSIGDVWALSLAERHPSRVARVALLGAGPLAPDIAPPGFIRLIASPLGAILVRLPVSDARTRAILRDSGHGASLDAGRIPDAFIDWRKAVSNATRAMRNERTMIRRLVRGSGWAPGFAFSDADLGRIEAPVLLVHGGADPLATTDRWRRFVDALPNGRLEVIEGAGHHPWFDEPERVAAIVGRFAG